MKKLQNLGKKLTKEELKKITGGYGGTCDGICLANGCGCAGAGACCSHNCVGFIGQDLGYCAP